MEVEFRISRRSEVRMIEVMGAISREADLAQRSAMRAARTRAASIGVKEMAAASNTIAKVWRGRVKAYARRTQSGLASGKLWFGLKLPPGGQEHKTVKAAIIASDPSMAFEATMPRTGHRGIFRRKSDKRLPIEEMFLRIPPGVRDIALRAARTAMRTRYVEVLTTDHKKRMAKVAQRG